MKTLDSGLAAHLASGATTLCRCWRLVRRDGVVFGFTDHDRDLAFDGTLYRAESGLTASRMETSLGLAVDDMTVVGALKDESLQEGDLSRGLFDDAEVVIFLVNWQTVSERTILRRGHIGEVSRSPHHFVAEIRSLAHKLDQAEGRAYQFGCDADLGDERCGVALAAPAFTGNGTVDGVVSETRIFTASGLGAFAGGFFSRGRLLWLTGANAGHAHEVKRHEVGALVTLDLWLPAPAAIAAGDTFAVSAGCDKQFTTCRVKFANGVNFRGFPHMPGNDFVISYPSDGDVLDGGSRFGGGGSP